MERESVESFSSQRHFQTFFSSVNMRTYNEYIESHNQ
jgi:hypothetical protein